MTDVMSLLPKFNRKERFALVGYALGNPEFRLGSHFRAKLSVLFDGLAIPENAFAAMDYHLDWVHAVMWFSRGHALDEIIERREHSGRITATQEDVDFLIAFEQGDTTHITLLEAKGATGYTNQQFQSKLNRLSAIFEGYEQWLPRVSPHFAVISPRPPQRLNLDEAKPWMLDSSSSQKKLRWLRLPWPDDLLKVTRCDQSGKRSAEGNYWRVIKG